MRCASRDSLHVPAYMLHGMAWGIMRVCSGVTQITTLESLVDFHLSQWSWCERSRNCSILIVKHSFATGLGSEATNSASSSSAIYRWVWMYKLSTCLKGGLSLHVFNYKTIKASLRFHYFHYNHYHPQSLSKMCKVDITCRNCEYVQYRYLT